jgi:hypothetical protein
MNSRIRLQVVIPTVLVIGIFLAIGDSVGQREPIPVKPRPVGTESPSYVPRDGFVPDERTAIAIAEAILIPIMGEKEVLIERPFQANLSGEVWIVTGTLPRGFVGGTAIVKIARRDGRILHMTHEQ